MREAIKCLERANKWLSLAKKMQATNHRLQCMKCYHYWINEVRRIVDTLI